MLSLSKGQQILRIPELRRKVFIIAVVLVFFRLLANIPVPGVNAEALRQLFSSSQLLGFLNLFSGGALSNLSIVMLGLGPYITAIIIMQLLTMVFPKLKAIYYQEGERGRAKFYRYSRYLTVPLSAMQGFGFLKLLISQGVLAPLAPIAMFANVLVIVAGSMILVWLGELITEQKLGNGVSILIFAGIVASFPLILRNVFLSYDPSNLPTYISFVVLALIVIVAIVFVNEGERKVPVSYAKRIRGNKLYGGVASYLPLRVGQAGVIPIIFAISLLLFPQFLAQVVSAFSTELGTTLNNLAANFLNNQLIYGLIYFFLVFLFTYFYVSVTFDPNEISQSLHRSGGFVAGIRPGKPTADFIRNIVTRINFFGGAFLGLIAILPIITQALTRTQVLTIGGTSILIMVAVALETAKQLDAEISVHEYERGIR
ncbi:MAG: preprotein translocase subunit SecY [Candidatus Colwellbacteria bacterium]|nr:preprotein translocase subunit SecY [Candidatus Colwellbacteria bacterium]